MKTTELNICPDCVHFKTCVLTAHKEKVWSCSEFENVHFLDLANRPPLEKQTVNLFY
ncbi:hypothetical protein BN863_15200 [Formosa agariphila KMM 3901]|uniref:Uncharacterized protein n=1 Tax=Formosa agariphila (strain DSM 15362 / KCTC 12365 / LMG 23005 / KMM 3901 / M-2Alg 35-1) TaxID=1347342 RepID=T2KK11_FORAG|nr:hypothetical protein BN863_15200 [Formosa agariphila KMM 3901]